MCVCVRACVCVWCGCVCVGVCAGYVSVRVCWSWVPWVLYLKISDGCIVSVRTSFVCVEVIGGRRFDFLLCVCCERLCLYLVSLFCVVFVVTVRIV